MTTALSDIVFPESEDDFILELPVGTYAGTLSDIVYPDTIANEVTLTAGGGNTYSRGRVVNG